MNDFKEQYLKKKKEVLDCLRTAEEFLEEHGYLHEAKMTASQRENLESGEFSIAVIGEFSAGKSTFLNALMGEQILPSFTSETTATINFLRHKDRAENGEGGKVYYNDGREETIQNADFSTISSYVSTGSATVNVAKSVSHLDLYLNSRFLENNVTLVDTPGLNGIAEGHRELTEEQIEKSSASIFLFDANQPGSKSDFEFLTELRRRVKSILFVLNKIDIIKSSEGETVETVVAKLKENYKRVYPDAETIPEIWAIAAYPALVARSSGKMDYRGKNEFAEEEKAQFEEISRMKPFEDRLWKYLTQGEKAKSELLAPVVQLIEHFRLIQNSNKAELNTLSGAIDSGEIECQQAELSKQMVELEEKLQAQTRGMKKALKNAEREFFEAVDSECEQCGRRCEASVDNFLDIEDIDAKAIENRVKMELSKIGENAYRDYCDALLSIQDEFAGDITDGLNDALSEALNVKLDRRLDLPEYTVGLEDFEKSIAEIKKEIERLSREADKSEDDWAGRMQLKRKREILEEKLERKKEARDHYAEESMESVPEINARMTQEFKQKPRGGLVGKIATFFAGEKYELRQVEIIDRERHDEYLADRNRILERKDKEIEECEEQLAQLPPEDAEAAERIAKRKAEALSEKRAELAAYQKEFADKVKRQGEVQLKRQKSEIRNFIDTVAGDFKDQCKASFRKGRDARVNVMLQMIGSSLRKQIEIKQKELERLSKQLNSATLERNEKEERIRAEQNKVKGILKTALDIESDLNDIRTDSISESKL